MPKSVAAVTAAHISTLIDSVRAAASRAKPRLMGEGMRMIVWGCCQSRQSMHMISGAGIHAGRSPSPRFSGSTLPTSSVFLPSTWKGNGLRGRLLPFIRFGATWCNQYWQSGETERRPRQSKDLAAVLYKKAEERKIPPLWPSERTTVSFDCASLRTRFQLRLVAFAGLNERWLIFKSPSKPEVTFFTLNPTEGWVRTFDCKNGF